MTANLERLVVTQQNTKQIYRVRQIGRRFAILSGAARKPRGNVFVADGKEFAYMGPQGRAPSTATIEGEKLIVVTRGQPPKREEDTVTTERYIDGDGRLVQIIRHDQLGVQLVRYFRRRTVDEATDVAVSASGGTGLEDFRSRK